MVVFRAALSRTALTVVCAERLPLFELFVGGEILLFSPLELQTEVGERAESRDGPHKGEQVGLVPGGQPSVCSRQTQLKSACVYSICQAHTMTLLTGRPTRACLYGTITLPRPLGQEVRFPTLVCCV
jgi:hypothetical protein